MQLFQRLTKLSTKAIYALVCLFLLFLNYSSHASNKDSIDNSLERKLNTVMKDFEGEAGIYVYHFAKQAKVGINHNKLFPTASMIKVPIMLTLFNKIDAGDLSYNDKMLYKDSLLYSGDDILGSFKDGEQVVLSKLVMLMITMSDNTASLWCQHLAGTGTAINDWLSDAGMKKTRMNSRTPGRHNDWKKYGWGQTTPYEMASLVAMIGQKKAINTAASEEMFRVMGNIYWNSEALSQIPPEIGTASKQGSVSQSRSEVVYVNAPSGDYVFCVITNKQEDTSWDHSNAGFQLIRDASKIIWEHYEPDYPYSAPKGYEKWLK